MKENYKLRREIACVMQAELLYLEAEEKRNPQMTAQEHRGHIEKCFGSFLQATMRAKRSLFSLPKLEPLPELREYMKKAAEIVAEIEAEMRREGGRLAMLNALGMEMISTQLSGSECQNSRVFLKVEGVVEVLLVKPQTKEEADALRFLKTVIAKAVSDAHARRGIVS